MIARTAELTFGDPEVEERALVAMANVALALVQEAKGFCGAYLFGPEAGEALLITLWVDQESHDEATATMKRAMAAIVAAGATVRSPIRFFSTVVVADARGVRKSDRPL